MKIKLFQNIRIPDGKLTETAPASWLSVRFLSDKKGSVAIVFALMTIVVVSLIGGAIDFGRAYSLQTRMQNSLDAASLGAASAYVNDPQHSVANALDHGNRYFNANMLGVSGAHMTSSLDVTTSTVSMTASVPINMPFLSVIGLDNVVLQASAVSTATEGVAGGQGDNDVEIAMMLDTTGSMGSSDGAGKTKIQALKDASKNLIDILIPDTGTIHAKIALAPFAPTVKVSDAQITNVLGLPLTKTTCTQTQTTNQCVNTTCKTFNKNGTCKTWNQSCTQVTTCTQNTTTYLRRCVTERTGAQALTDAAPGTNAYAGEYRPSGDNDAYTSSVSSAQSCTPNQAIVPLTSSKATLKATIDGFSANGATAGSLGTAWAWYLLSPKWAAALGNDVKPYGTSKLKKIAVLMTDGTYNTENAISYADGGTDSVRISNNAVALCKGMKAEGIEIYTVGFKLDNDLARTTLASCATDANHNFLAENGDQLDAVFKEIAYRAVPLYLAK